MGQVKIKWIGWVKRCQRWQAQTIVIGAYVILGLLLIVRLNENIHPTLPNRFDYALLIYYLLAASPVGEQLTYVAFPKNYPRYQYQVTSWRQWRQSVLASVVLFVVAVLCWPPKTLAALSFYLIATTVISFTGFWLGRWFRHERQRNQDKAE